MKKTIAFFLVILLAITNLACDFASIPADKQVTVSSLVSSDTTVFTNANVVRDLVVYKGTIYAATLGGMVTWKLDDGGMTKYTPQDGMGHVSATSIAFCEIPQPRIIVGTQNGISVFDPAGGTWVNELDFPDDSYVNKHKIDRLYCDKPNNRLLIGYSGLGVYDLKTGDFQRFTKDQGLLWDAVTDITVKGKEIWIANGYKGIAQISNGNVKAYSAAEGMVDERAYSLAFAKDGTLWVGGSAGIQSFKGGKWTLYGSDSKARLTDVNEIEVNTDGKIWAATLPMGTGRLCQFNPKTAACDIDYKDAENQGIFALTLTDKGIPVYGTEKGVYMFQKDTVKAFKTSDRLATNFIDSYATAPDGMLWVGTDGGIQVLDPAKPEEEWTTYRKSDIPEMGGSWAKGFAFAKDGTVWIAITNGGATRYQKGVWTAYKDIYSFDAVSVDNQDRVWFGDDSKGVIVLNPDGSQAEKFSTANGLPGDNVQSIITDLSGRVWIGTDKGLARNENKSLQVVFGKDSKELPDTYVRALALEADGSLIIGTYMGVTRYDGKKADVLLNFKDGFSEARLTTLAVAPSGRIWVGTDKGVIYSDDSVEWTKLTTKDGLLTNYISALHVDQYGAAWIGGGGSNFDGGGMLHIVP